MAIFHHTGRCNNCVLFRKKENGGSKEIVAVAYYDAHYFLF